MGELNVHDLESFNCDVFVETGTGKGTGLAHALKYKFDKVYSIEINDTLYNECNQKFKADNLELIHASSIDGLMKILPKMDKIKKFYSG